MLDSLSQNFTGRKGIGLIPDWCSVNTEDQFGILEGKNDVFGYESIRVPFRIGLDYFWFKSREAEEFLTTFSSFLEREFDKEGVVFCEYDYLGNVFKRYDNPAFYACYYYSLLSVKNRYAKVSLEKNRSRLQKDSDLWFYQDNQDYYLNCLAWFADGLKAGIIRNLYGGK